MDAKSRDNGAVNSDKMVIVSDADKMVVLCGSWISELFWKEKWDIYVALLMKSIEKSSLAIKKPVEISTWVDMWLNYNWLAKVSEIEKVIFVKV